MSEKEIPLREVILLFTPERFLAFGEKVNRLQQMYGSQSIVEAIERAVDEALSPRAEESRPESTR